MGISGIDVGSKGCVAGIRGVVGISGWVVGISGVVGINGCVPKRGWLGSRGLSVGISGGGAVVGSVAEAAAGGVVGAGKMLVKETPMGTPGIKAEPVEAPPTVTPTPGNEAPMLKGFVGAA